MSENRIQNTLDPETGGVVALPSYDRLELQPEPLVEVLNDIENIVRDILSGDDERINNAMEDVDVAEWFYNTLGRYFSEFGVRDNENWIRVDPRLSSNSLRNYYRTARRLVMSNNASDSPTRFLQMFNETRGRIGGFDRPRRAMARGRRAGFGQAINFGNNGGFGN